MAVGGQQHQGQAPEAPSRAATNSSPSLGAPVGIQAAAGSHKHMLFRGFYLEQFPISTCQFLKSIRLRFRRMTPLYFHKGVEGLLLGAKLREEIPYELRV